MNSTCRRPGTTRFMVGSSRTPVLIGLLVMVLVLSGCGNVLQPKLTSTATISRGPTATPAGSLAAWITRCSQNSSGKPFGELPGLTPGRSMVLALDPKNNQWKVYLGFSSLNDTTGQPETLICIYRSWTFVANYLYSDKRLVIPGYREDWKISLQVLATGETFVTPTLTGQEPAQTLTFINSPTALTEVVGNPPFDRANGLLLRKLNLP